MSVSTQKLALVLCLACVGNGGRQRLKVSHEKLLRGPITANQAVLQTLHPSSGTRAEDVFATLLLALEPAATFNMPHAGGRASSRPWVIGAQRYPDRTSAVSMRNSWSRRELLHGAAAALLATTAGVPSVWAAGKKPETKAECISECNQACISAAGEINKDYCTQTCDSFCADFGTPSFDQADSEFATSGYVGGASADPGARAKDDDAGCSRYQTPKAKAYCLKKSREAKALANFEMDQFAPRVAPEGALFEGFGGKKLDDLLATFFGATRQGRSVDKADVKGFAKEFSEKWKAFNDDK